MQRYRYREHENGGADDYSNFADLDWISSFQNSRQELLDRYFFLMKLLEIIYSIAFLGWKHMHLQSYRNLHALFVLVMEMIDSTSVLLSLWTIVAIIILDVLEVNALCCQNVVFHCGSFIWKVSCAIAS